MIYCFQIFNEHVLGFVYIVERDGAFAEISLIDLCVDNAVYQFAYRFVGIFFQRTRCRFHRIRHHQYGLLAGGWVRTGISKDIFVRFLAVMGILPGYIEIFRLAAPVVSGNERFHRRRKMPSELFLG